MGIKFNDQHIPDSPYKLFISPAMGDAHKLEVFQFPNSGVQADKPAAFLVRKNGAKGELDAKVSMYVVILLYWQAWNKRVVREAALRMVGHYTGHEAVVTLH